MCCAVLHRWNYIVLLWICRAIFCLYSGETNDDGVWAIFFYHCFVQFVNIYSGDAIGLSVFTVFSETGWLILTRLRLEAKRRLRGGREAISTKKGFFMIYFARKGNFKQKWDFSSFIFARPLKKGIFEQKEASLDFPPHEIVLIKPISVIAERSHPTSFYCLIAASNWRQRHSFINNYHMQFDLVDIFLARNSD